MLQLFMVFKTFVLESSGEPRKTLDILTTAAALGSLRYGLSL